MNRFERRTKWQLSGDPFFPWETEVGDERWQIRMNEFPEEPTVYSLVVDGIVVDDFNDWPKCWERPDLPVMQAGTAAAEKGAGSNQDDPYLEREYDEELEKLERQKKLGPSKLVK